MGREAKAKAERRRQREAIRAKAPPIERLAARLDLEKARDAHRAQMLAQGWVLSG
jgi:hypothetical protein